MPYRNQYGRWNAPSDRDYDDLEMLPPVVVTCVQCHTLFEVPYDEQGPYRCVPCCEHNAELEQQRQDRDVA